MSLSPECRTVAVSQEPAMWCHHHHHHHQQPQHHGRRNRHQRPWFRCLLERLKFVGLDVVVCISSTCFQVFSSSSSSSSSLNLSPFSHEQSAGVGRGKLSRFNRRSSFDAGNMSRCVTLTLVLLLLLGSAFPVSTFVPEISNFNADQRRYFTDSSNSEPFFHYLNIDPNNASSIYIGALDFVYRLNADNINIMFERSENITTFNSYSKIYRPAVEMCKNIIVGKPRPNYQCRNHVRGILPNFNNREIYVCATGSYSPQDFYLDVRTLRVRRIGYDPMGPDGSGSGITKCPYDPDTNHTIIFVGENRGVPNNLSAVYSSLMVGARYNHAIYRSVFQKDPDWQTQFAALRTEDPLTVGGGEIFYIASYEIDQYIYFFFREYASESSNFAHSHYARVARVCKNDKGGTLNRNKFLTYVKARLNCSVGTSDIPVYYNELYDVQYDAVNRIFYGLFMAHVNGNWGAAVCQFNYSTIVNKFDKDPFYGQQSINSQWATIPDSQVPKPRPSLCQNDTESLSVPSQSFALVNNMMYGTVDQMTRSPLYYSKDVAYSHMAVEVVQQFKVLYLYSFSLPFEIVRVVSWVDDNQQVRFRRVAVLKPFGSHHRASPLWDLKIHAVNGKKWLYIVTDKAVIQLSVELCISYTRCTECVKDPHCGWNTSSSRCEKYQEGSRLVQGVTGRSSLSVCGSRCTIRAESKALPGTALHLNCASHCSPEGAVTWTFQRTPYSSQVEVPVFFDANYILSQSNGLVILNVTRHHIGTFRCFSEGITLAEHNVTTSACAYGEDVREIWIREFVNWCRAFDQYQAEYNTWLCLKSQCLKSSCVTKEVLESCSKPWLT